MAADKGESGSAQAGEAAKQTKKPRAAPKKKTQSLAEKTVAEAKAAFVDIDLSEGRSLRKRAGAPASHAPKTQKKAATKVKLEMSVRSAGSNLRGLGEAMQKAAAPPKKAKGSEETRETKASAAKAE